MKRGRRRQLHLGWRNILNARLAARGRESPNQKGDGNCQDEYGDNDSKFARHDVSKVTVTIVEDAVREACILPAVQLLAN